MKKLLFALASVALLISSPALAEFGYIIGAATVDGVTTTACTTGRNQTVSGFFNGEDADQIWALEKEVGSQGSGAFAVVSGYTDVFPTANGGAAVANAIQITRYTSEEPACFRLHMTTDGGGTAQVQLVTDRDAVTAKQPRSTHFELFDDFFQSVLPVAALGSQADWIAFLGTSQNNVVAIGEASPEGIMTLTGGDTGDIEDYSEVTLGLDAYAATVSEGLIIFETRLSMEDIDAGDVNFGLTEDVAVNGHEENEFFVNTNVITDKSTVSSAAMFAYSSDAYLPLLWHAVSTNATAIGNAEDEYSLGNSPTAATYQLFRIEVDTLGHVYWYIEGLLMGAEPLAVAVAATLMPYFGAGSAVDCGGGCDPTKLDIDYVYFSGARPDGT
tara:strand:+ start:2970 stop:4127 length:1158 start_codon:yes stop_codon:yes gene_type:complete